MYDLGLHQQPAKASGNIYLTLLQIYLNPRKTTNNIEKRINNLVLTPTPKSGWTSVKGKGRGLGKKIADIEGAEDTRISASGTDSGKSDGEGDGDEDGDAEGISKIMLDEVLDVLSQRWDRVQGAQALKLLPKETKLQVTGKPFVFL